MNSENAPCCHGGYEKMHRFLEFCLLLLLKEESSHGYGLIEKLPYFGFSSEELNIGNLYKTLRKMESQEFVNSHWVEGGQGPKKRVYEIASLGLEELNIWIEALKRRKVMIEKAIGRYDKISAAQGKSPDPVPASE